MKVWWRILPTDDYAAHPGAIESLRQPRLGKTRRPLAGTKMLSSEGESDREILRRKRKAIGADSVTLQTTPPRRRQPGPMVAPQAVLRISGGSFP